MSGKQEILNGTRFIRFIIVGIFNTGFGYGLYAILLYLGFHYIFASFISTLLGILFNFFTTGSLVFKNTESNRIVRFYMTYGVTYVTGVIGLSLLDVLGIDMYLAGLMMIPPTALLSYTLNHLFVFGGKQ